MNDVNKLPFPGRYLYFSKRFPENVSNYFRSSIVFISCTGSDISTLFQTEKSVLVICKNEDDSIKNEGARVVTAFFPS